MKIKRRLGIGRVEEIDGVPVERNWLGTIIGIGGHRVQRNPWGEITCVGHRKIERGFLTRRPKKIDGEKIERRWRFGLPTDPFAALAVIDDDEREQEEERDRRIRGY